MRLKLLIADDHQLMLEGIRLALADAPDIEIVGETSSGAQVLPLVRQTSPDVVLLDLRMPGMDGLRCLESLRQRHPEVKTVVLSGSDEPDVIEAAFQRGAAAFILKRIDPVDLAPVIRQALDGNVFYPVETRPAAAETRELGPDDPRGGHPQGARRGALEQADRPPVLAVGADDQVPPHEHLPQARRRQPHGSRPSRLRARDDREPDAPRDRRVRLSRRCAGGPRTRSVGTTRSGERTRTFRRCGPHARGMTMRATLGVMLEIQTPSLLPELVERLHGNGCVTRSIDDRVCHVVHPERDRRRRGVAGGAVLPPGLAGEERRRRGDAASRHDQAAPDVRADLAGPDPALVFAPARTVPPTLYENRSQNRRALPFPVHFDLFG